jgi:hypothetical protein
VQFELSETMDLDIALVDVQGKQINLIKNRSVQAGKNELIFMTSELSKGVYFLKISNQINQIIHSEQLIK